MVFSTWSILGAGNIKLCKNSSGSRSIRQWKIDNSVKIADKNIFINLSHYCRDFFITGCVFWLALVHCAHQKAAPKSWLKYFFCRFQPFCSFFIQNRKFDQNLMKKGKKDLKPLSSNIHNTPMPSTPRPIRQVIDPTLGKIDTAARLL